MSCASSSTRLMAQYCALTCGGARVAADSPEVAALLRVVDAGPWYTNSVIRQESAASITSG